MSNRKTIVINTLEASKSHVRFLFEICSHLDPKRYETIFISYKENLQWATSVNKNITTISIDDSMKNGARILALNSRYPDNSYRSYFAKVKRFADFAENYHYKDFEKKSLLILNLFLSIKPDLVICDFTAIHCIDSATHLKLPLMIGIQPLEFGYMITDSSYVINNMFYKSLDIREMNIIDKIWFKLIDPFYQLFMLRKAISKANKARQKLGFKKYYTNSESWGKALVLANNFEGFEVPRKLSPNVKFVGPIIPKSSKEQQEFQKPIQTFIDSRQNLIYIAFGSIFTLDKNDIGIIIATVVHLKKTGIIDGAVWSAGRTSIDAFEKYEKDILQNDILILSWIPQLKLFETYKDKIKVFITHGGLESIFECLHFGIKPFVYPFLLDQPRNGEKIKDVLGVGDYVIRSDKLRKEELISKIKRLIIDDKQLISKNLERAQILMNSYPENEHYSNANKAANLISETIKLYENCKDIDIENNSYCGVSHLVTLDKTMPFYKAYLLDVYAMAFVIVVSVIFVLKRLLFKTIHSVMSLCIIIENQKNTKCNKKE